MVREHTYGYFPGGNYDPREFEPDYEVNTPDEIAAWERLCAAWDAGCASVVFRSGLHEDTEGGPMFRCGSPLGMGAYWIDMPDDEPDPGAEEDIPPVVLVA